MAKSGCNAKTEDHHDFRLREPGEQATPYPVTHRIDEGPPSPRSISYDNRAVEIDVPGFTQVGKLGPVVLAALDAASQLHQLQTEIMQREIEAKKAKQVAESTKAARRQMTLLDAANALPENAIESALTE